MGLDKTLNELAKAYFYVHRLVTRGIVTSSLGCKNILSALEFCNSTIYCKNTTQLVRLLENTIQLIFYELSIIVR